MSSSNAATYPVATIAKLLLISERRVQQLSAEGVIPKAERGRYELATAVQGYIRFLQERSLSSESSPTDYHTEKALLTKAQREMAELDLAKLKCEVAPIRDFERAQAKIFAQIRANVLNVPQRVVTQLLGETDETDFKLKLKKELSLALEAAAKADLTLDDEEVEDEE